VGLFRPARTVTSPNGDRWELYVSKTALPAWRSSDGDMPYTETLNAELDLLQLPLALLSFVWGSILVPLVRFSVLLPVAVVRGRRSRAVRIEAMRTFPEREVLLWTTTDMHVPRALDEIAAGLAAGEVPRPDACVYAGRE